MPGYVVKIYKSLGGRSDEGQWSNRYVIESENTLDSPELAAEVAYIVTKEKGWHLQATHFMRSVTTTIEEEGRGNSADKVVTLELQGTGGRAIPAEAKPLPKQMALAVKTAAKSGRAGTMAYRGALHTLDVTFSADGKVSLLSAGDLNSNGIDTMATAQGHPNFVFAKVGEALDGTERPIIRFLASGVMFRQTRNHKRKGAEVDEESVLDKIGELLPIAISILTFVLTKGKALPAAGRVELATATGGIASVLKNIVDALTDAVT